MLLERSRSSNLKEDQVNRPRTACPETHSAFLGLVRGKSYNWLKNHPNHMLRNQRLLGSQKQLDGFFHRSCYILALPVSSAEATDFCWLWNAVPGSGRVRKWARATSPGTWAKEIVIKYLERGVGNSGNSGSLYKSTLHTHIHTTPAFDLSSSNGTRPVLYSRAPLSIYECVCFCII